MNNAKWVSFSKVFLVFCTSGFSQVELSPIYESPMEAPPFELLSSSSYGVYYDINMSPYAGGEDLLLATRLVEKGVASLIKKTSLAYSKSMIARTWRLNELFLVWLPLNYLAMVVQHEVFGHGYRIRSIGHGKAAVTGYSFAAPPPYGPGGGETRFVVSDAITTTDLACIAMAGIEATSILAQETALKWVSSRVVDPRQTVLYLLCRYDLNMYAQDETLEIMDIDGHDLVSYVHALNDTYPQGRCTVSHLRDLSLINLLDPFTYYSIFSWVHYLSSGKETKLPMIPIFGYGYLFGARLGLTPFGPEIFIDQYLVKGNDPFYFYVKGGLHAQNSYWGAGFFAPTIAAWRHWTLGARFDAWRQTEWGVAASVIGSYQVKTGSLQVEAGCKTDGFLPGYPLTGAPTVRLSWVTDL